MSVIHVLKAHHDYTSGEDYTNLAFSHSLLYLHTVREALLHIQEIWSQHCLPFEKKCKRYKDDLIKNLKALQDLHDQKSKSLEQCDIDINLLNKNFQHVNHPTSVDYDNLHAEIAKISERSDKIYKKYSDDRMLMSQRDKTLLFNDIKEIINEFIEDKKCLMYLKYFIPEDATDQYIKTYLCENTYVIETLFLI